MNRITDFYNQSYIYLNLQLNKNIASKNGKINEAVNNFFSNKGVKIQDISTSDRLKIKAHIIKTYKKEGSKDEDTRLGTAIYISTQKMERKLMLSKIASTPIKFEKIKNYEEKKTAYLNELKNSTLDADKELKKYLNDPNVQKLAGTIEHDFFLYQNLEAANLSTGMTLNDFARLMVSKYEPAILEIFKGKDAVGRDDFAAVYLSLILLQKGDDFATAVTSLNNNMEKMDVKERFFLAPLMSKVATPTSIVEGIQDYKLPS